MKIFFQVEKVSTVDSIHYALYQFLLDKEGKEFLQKLLAENNKGIVLIIVAGKNYAKFVEAKGYNVLASATLRAEAMIKQALDVLKV